MKLLWVLSFQTYWNSRKNCQIKKVEINLKDLFNKSSLIEKNFNSINILKYDLETKTRDIMFIIKKKKDLVIEEKVPEWLFQTEMLLRASKWVTEVRFVNIINLNQQKVNTKRKI